MLINLSRVSSVLRRIFIKHAVLPNCTENGLKLYRIQSHGEFLDHQVRSEQQLAELSRITDVLEQENGKRFSISGYSYPAGRQTEFLIERGGDGKINWRETLNCAVTGFNNRMRATFHLFDIEMAPYPDCEIYITEQITPIYTYFKSKYPSTIGSEFLGERCPYGTIDKNGVRNETLTALSFPDQSFDILISLDVLEHIPDYQLAFKECARVLRPGGKMLWSVPFAANSPSNIVRAKIENDKIVHILPPEYHGDPLSTDGVLCFQYFGWEMVEMMRDVGFQDAYALCYHSNEFGYLGGEQFMFVAFK